VNGAHVRERQARMHWSATRKHGAS